VQPGLSGQRLKTKFSLVVCLLTALIYVFLSFNFPTFERAVVRNCFVKVMFDFLEHGVGYLVDVFSVN